MAPGKFFPPPPFPTNPLPNSILNILNDTCVRHGFPIEQKSLPQVPQGKFNYVSYQVDLTFILLSLDS